MSAAGSGAPLSADLRCDAALVVDANPTTRMTLAGQLRSFGFTSISQTGRIADARREIERHPFDLVVCADTFPRGGSGQELLDDLRRSGLLPYGTVFILITDEATYLKVVEAAESSVDSYIVRPYSAATLYDRIEQAQRRKAALWEIYRALEERRYDDAIERCLERVATQGPQWLSAARWGAEIMLRLGRFGQAQALFQSIWDAQAQPWALLGVARCQLDSGAPSAALGTLRQLIEVAPDYPDAYDVLGRAQMELGRFDDALDSLQRALEATPMAIGRQQRLGTLAFFLGNRDKAVELLQRATYLGLDSKMFDAESLVLLAIAAFERHDAAELERHQAELAKRARGYPDDNRLQRFVALVDLLAQALPMVQRIEQALRRAHDGEPVLALAELCTLAQDTLNARAVESAWLVLQRYQRDMPNPERWQQRVQALRQSYGTARNRPALGDPRLRPSGGVHLGPMDRAPAPVRADNVAA